MTEKGVAAVDRALSIMGALGDARTALTLSEIAAATGLYKSNALRLLASLARARFVARDGDARYRLYSKAPEAEKRHSLTRCIGTKRTIEGKPDPNHISIRYTERSNLSVRTFMRRFTLLALDFSKKFENRFHMVALYTVWYDSVKMHKTLKMTPATAARVSNRLFGRITARTVPKRTRFWAAQTRR